MSAPADVLRQEIADLLVAAWRKEGGFAGEPGRVEYAQADAVIAYFQEGNA